MGSFCYIGTQNQLDLTVSGGLLVFIREDILCSILNIKQLTLEALFIEINLRKIKWLLCCPYNPYKNLIVAYLREILVALDVLF